jgi:hypothetical protein
MIGGFQDLGSCASNQTKFRGATQISSEINLAKFFGSRFTGFGAAKGIYLRIPR